MKRVQSALEATINTASGISRRTVIAENLLLRIAPTTLGWALGITLLSAVADRFVK